MKSAVMSVIHSFKRKENEEIRTSLKEWKKKRYIDLRLWFTPDGQTEARPTKKGITVGVDLLPELMLSLQKAEEEVGAAI